jgi:SAM-dependent methyltransferase
VKSSTDAHWDARARAVDSSAAVNIDDVYQRELELEFVCGVLGAGQRVLEVGCGNGFNTVRFRELVESVDAFDYSGDMIARANRDHPDPRVRYYEASVLDPAAAQPGTFDVVICIRTLINLADLAEQRAALENMFSWLRPAGLLVLVEGFRDGFEALNELRTELGLPPLQPASINTYTAVADLQDIMRRRAEMEAEFHSGTWDILTRVTLPFVAGPEQATGVGPFHPGLLELARRLGNERTERFARLRGWALRTRDG